MADNERHMQWAGEAESELRRLYRDRGTEIERLNGVIVGAEKAHAASVREIRRDYRDQLVAKDEEIARLTKELSDVRAALSSLQAEIHTAIESGSGSVVNMDNRRKR